MSVRSRIERLEWWLINHSADTVTPDDQIRRIASRYGVDGDRAVEIFHRGVPRRILTADTMTYLECALIEERERCQAELEEDDEESEP